MYQYAFMTLVFFQDSVIGTYLPTSSGSDDKWNSPLLQALQSGGGQAEPKVESPSASGEKLSGWFG
jgi:hypothetical protein